MKLLIVNDPLSNHEHGFTDATVSPDGCVVAVSSLDMKVYVCDVAMGMLCLQGQT
jgi:hypothetical protein